MLRVVTAVVLVSLASPVAVLSGQEPDSSAINGTAFVYGHLVDAVTRKTIGGAEVTLTGPTTVAVRTDERGVWRSPPLEPGLYALRVRSPGYSPRNLTLELTPGAEVDRPMALNRIPFTLDEVVVTASRREQRLKDVAITTELVTRDDIERTGASDVASVLIEQTGIDLQGGHPAGTGIMLQGIGSERVLILLDGQPVAGRISGVFDVSRIPVSMVERIEVVKGPQSTLYGSEAMGGVVNIITRNPSASTLGSTAALTVGTQGRLDGAGGVVAGRGPLTVSADLSRRLTETTPGLSDNLGALAARTDVATKVRWRPDTTLSLEAGLLALDERQRWRTGNLYTFSDNRQWSGRLSGTWHRGRHRLSPTIFASVFDHLSRGSTQPKPIAGDTGQRQIQRLHQAEVLYSVRMGSSGAHVLDLGTQVRHDETESARILGGVRSLTSYEPFVQLEVAPTQSLSVLPGVRVSHNSRWGTHTTPRVAARYMMTERLTLRGSVGTGYRAPDFKELYMFFQNTAAGYSVIGSPDLRPESSRNLTAGAEWAGNHAYLRSQFFVNGFRDFIETRVISAPEEPPLYQYANVADGFTRGVDFETGVAFGGLRIEGGYSALRTHDRSTGHPLLGRPSQSGRMTLGYALPGGVRTSVTGVYTGRTAMQRDEATGVVTSWRDTFMRVDARVARRMWGGFELAVGADNVFDKQPAQWAGFTGRHLYTALSWERNRKETR